MGRVYASPTEVPGREKTKFTVSEAGAYLAC